MAGLDIATGDLSDHDSGVQPLHGGSGIDPVAPVTATSPSGPAQGGVMDTTGMNLQQQAEGTADCAAAMAEGMTGKHGLNDRYEAQGMPLGGHIGNAMDLPVVPTNAVPPAASDDYPYAGMEPTPSAAGFAGTYGAE